MRDSLQDVGCTDVDVHVAQADWSPFSSAEVVSECDPMFKSFPGYQALTASEAELLRNSLQAAFDGYADTSGKIHLPTKAFMATARID
ncbi:hypothetical protein [Phyllobacterium phragmitis]|uniref:hypothetical protein n=1 Tax=Phyllobacterium phragmitis TaxID=2670329 RepID=UPI0011B1FED6|nr:hypothetical protein [Phyllobacterium phragmitis]